MRSVLARAVFGAVVLTACSATPPEPSAIPFFFPQHSSALGHGDDALLEGVPTVRDGCLLIVADDGTTFLPLWPADTLLGSINSQPAILSPTRDLLVEAGDVDPNDRAQLGGSEASAERAAALVGEIPDRCAADRYWVVSDVVNRP